MANPDYLTNADFVLALRQARIATRKSDIVATERWLTIAERFLRIRQRKQELDNPDIRRDDRWRR